MNQPKFHLTALIRYVGELCQRTGFAISSLGRRACFRAMPGGVFFVAGDIKKFFLKKVFPNVSEFFGGGRNANSNAVL